MDTILCADTETTGLDPKSAALIEIGAVLWSIPEASIVATWSDVIAHPVLSNDAIAINRIAVGTLNRGISHTQALAHLQSFAARADVLVAHRAEFDVAFLPGLNLPVCCSKFDIEWPSSSPGASLVDVALAHGVPVFENHRALTDALLLARTFEAVARSGVDVREMLARAMRPRVWVQALVSFDEKDKAKNEGFGWDPATKRWTKRVVEEDLLSGAYDSGVVGFTVRPIAEPKRGAA